MTRVTTDLLEIEYEAGGNSDGAPVLLPHGDGVIQFHPQGLL
jgi:hypothetical protein